MNKKLVSIISLALLVICVEAQVRDAFDGVLPCYRPADEDESER